MSLILSNGVVDTVSLPSTLETEIDMKFPEFNKTYMENMYEDDIGSMINAITEDKEIEKSGVTSTGVICFLDLAIIISPFV